MYIKPMVVKKYFWLYIFFILVVSYLCTQVLREELYIEGFRQSKPFILKSGANAYDNFYAEIYDIINIPEEAAAFDYDTIITNTLPDSEHSNFLIVGSGTGDLVNKLTVNGYNAHGIDKSQAMIDICKTKYPTDDNQCACVEVVASFDKNSFTHIVCSDYTLYYMKDKYNFFRRCYNWLIPNGYLIVHIVDKHNFTPVKPCVNKILDVQLSKESALRNINRTNVDFGDFTYNVNYDMNKLSTDRMGIKETFTDKGSKKVRQNEITLHIEDMKNVLTTARNAGFIQHSLYKLPEDSHQFVVILERIG
jgi:SAM-dependent methyltransferase